MGTQQHVRTRFVTTSAGLQRAVADDLGQRLRLEEQTPRCGCDEQHQRDDAQHRQRLGDQTACCESQGRKQEAQAHLPSHPVDANGRRGPPWPKPRAFSGSPSRSHGAKVRRCGPPPQPVDRREHHLPLPPSNELVLRERISIGLHLSQDVFASAEVSPRAHPPAFASGSPVLNDYPFGCATLRTEPVQQHERKFPQQNTYGQHPAAQPAADLQTEPEGVAGRGCHSPRVVAGYRRRATPLLSGVSCWRRGPAWLYRPPGRFRPRMVRWATADAAWASARSHPRHGAWRVADG